MKITMEPYTRYDSCLKPTFTFVEIWSGHYRGDLQGDQTPVPVSPEVPEQAQGRRPVAPGICFQCVP